MPLHLDIHVLPAEDLDQPFHRLTAASSPPRTSAAANGPDDGRLVATVDLGEPDAWVRPVVPLTRYTGSRRFRRIDLRISRVVPPFSLGVMTGEVSVR